MPGGLFYAILVTYKVIAFAQCYLFDLMTALLQGLLEELSTIAYRL